MRIFFLFLFFLLTMSLNAQNQNDNQSERSIGITANIQGEQLGFLIPIWVSSKIVLAPALDIQISQNIASDIGLGLLSKFYFKTTALSPYVGARLGAFIYYPADNNTFNTDDSTDILGGVLFGGEYFFNRQFSAGVELQFNGVKTASNSARFGNPDSWNFNTGSLAFISIYF